MEFIVFLTNFRNKQNFLHRQNVNFVQNNTDFSVNILAKHNTYPYCLIATTVCENKAIVMTTIYQFFDTKQ